MLPPRFVEAGRLYDSLATCVARIPLGLISQCKASRKAASSADDLHPDERNKTTSFLLKMLNSLAREHHFFSTLQLSTEPRKQAQMDINFNDSDQVAEHAGHVKKKKTNQSRRADPPPSNSEHNRRSSSSSSTKTGQQHKDEEPEPFGYGTWTKFVLPATTRF